MNKKVAKAIKQANTFGALRDTKPNPIIAHAYGLKRKHNK